MTTDPKIFSRFGPEWEERADQTATDQDISNLFGAEWEERAEQLLGTTLYDRELGIRVSRDAQLVVAGALSEADFYQKYHEDYLKEFDVDDRPINPGGDAGDTPGGGPEGTQNVSAPGPNTNGSVSRRTFLKLTGGSAAAAALSVSLLGQMMSSASAEAAQGNGGSPQVQGDGGAPQHAGTVQMGMVIDLERCTGCLACVDACHRENNTSPGVHWMYVIAHKDEKQKGAFVPITPDVENQNDENLEDPNFLLRLCQHCTDAPCLKVCPTTARHKREKDGLVLTDYDKCLGTRYCEVACPYGVNFFQWGEPNPERPGEGFMHGREDYRGRKVAGNPPRGVMGKCTFCPQRQDNEYKAGTTACQLACPHDVIHFGDMNDPNSAPRRYLEKRREESGGSLSTYRLLEGLGTQPNILYIGHQPSKHAKQVAGPTTYEDWGWVDERRTVMEGPRPWFMKLFGDD